MKRLSDYTEQSLPVQNISTIDPTPEPISVDLDIPDRLLSDPEISGYQDEQIQIDTYDTCFKGELPFIGKLSVLDIGCKRGDVYGYITSFYPELILEYTGIDPNPLMKEVGNKKYQQLALTTGNRFDIISDEFLNHQFPENTKFDIISIVGSFNQLNGIGYKDWDYIEAVLANAVSLANEKVVFTALQSNSGIDQYIGYPLPNMCELLLKLNYRFKILHGYIHNMYTVIINCEQKIILT